MSDEEFSLRLAEHGAKMGQVLEENYQLREERDALRAHLEDIKSVVTGVTYGRSQKEEAKLAAYKRVVSAARSVYDYNNLSLMSDGYSHELSLALDALARGDK